jgi:endonuclease/exonuclease/phosphatase family metal-dependent hydrolase
LPPGAIHIAARCPIVYSPEIPLHTTPRYLSMMTLDPVLIAETPVRSQEPAAPRAESPRKRAFRFATLALGACLGVHALRVYIAMAVWNVGDDMPISLRGLLPAAVCALGLLAGPARRLVAAPRSTWLAGAFAVCIVLRQVMLPYDTPGAVLSFVAWILWLWWLPAVLEEYATTNDLALITPAFASGIALQVGLQAALHGLDLPLRSGPASIAGAAILAVVFFAVSLAGTRASQEPTQMGEAPHRRRSDAGWGAVALGPYLFLQLTLLASAGRVAQGTGWTHAWASGLCAIALLAGAASTTFATGRRVRLVLAALMLVWLTSSVALGNAAALALVPVQIALSLLLAGAFSLDGQQIEGAYTGTLCGALGFFALLFLFYDRFEMPLLWPLAGLLRAFLGAAAMRSRRISTLWPVAATAVPVALALGIALVPPAGSPRAGDAPPALTVMTYNIHQGFDDRAVPSLPRIAATIEEADADVIALQEVGRGWDLLGGTDIIAWLRWRFPQYHVVYGPTHGALWGNAILSRYRVPSPGSSPFANQASRFQYGFVWARIPTTAGDLLFTSTHVAPGLTGGTAGSRAEQAGELTGLWGDHPRGVLAGDYNSLPADDAVVQTLEEGFNDLALIAGDTSATFSAGDPKRRIDYIFVTSGVQPIWARVPRSTASDHLPVIARLRLLPGR